jgi:putative membrane protein
MLRVLRDVSAMRRLLAVLSFFIATPSRAHGDVTLAPDAPALWLYALMSVAAILYLRGLLNLWSAAGRGHGVARREAAAFLAGLGLLAVLVSNVVEGATTSSFATHMVQHEVLMLVIAPLLVLGRPLATWAWALRPSARTRVARVFAHRAWRVPWTAFTSPMGAAAAQLALLVAWHLPGAFDRAVSHPWLHALQHTCFLAPALAFWWSVLEARRRRHVGGAMAALFITMTATGALGALLTFAPRPWYATGLSPGNALLDQQLGGLLMWVPGGIVYLLAALWLMAGWLAREARRPHAAGTARQ